MHANPSNSFRARKSLGQNFLMHAKTAERIADAARISSNDTVLEIGPGTGKLTKPLLARGGKVIAIEADERLFAQLQETFATEIKEKRLELIHGDIREFDASILPVRYALVANIPYYLTGEIIRVFLSAEHKPFSMTLLLQKEVAERIARAKKESLLSIAVKTYGTPKYCFTVPNGAFVPAPKVDSAVLAISSIHSPFLSASEESRFFEVLHAGFAHKRKLLARNLEEIAGREVILDAFRTLELPISIRAEDVPCATWLPLSKMLVSNAHVLHK
jgi:16S rRNA (adenine1518-N6/adenine1519-N6)-dimethyltransferase